MAAVAHLTDGVWLDQAKVEEEEYNYHVYMAGGSVKPVEKRVKVAAKKGAKDTGSGVAEQIAQARQKIHQTLQESDVGFSADVAAKLKRLESDNADLRKVVDMLVQKMAALDARLGQLESGGQSTSPQQKPQPATQKPASPAADDDDDDDDSDIDLFGSDDDEEEAAEAAKIREERLAAYAAKKAKKPGPIAKSSIILYVKPWDDETDMADLERKVRTIEKDGLLWGASKLVEIAYGIQKLQISCVVEDEKIGTDFLEEEITAFEDIVQSVDIAAFNKI